MRGAPWPVVACVVAVVAVAASCVAAAPAVPVTQFVNVLGQRYAAASDADPTLISGGACNATQLHELPAGWTLVDSQDARALLALRFFPFGSPVAVFADGTQVTTGASQTSLPGNGLVSDGSSQFGVDACPKVILLTQPGEASDTDEISSVASTLPAVVFRGTAYATPDGAEPSATAGSGCQTIPYILPDGWSVAEDRDAVGLVTSRYAFGTSCLVIADGRSFDVNNAACGDSQLQFYAYSGLPTVLAVNGCQRRIVITRDALPSEAEDPVLAQITSAAQPKTSLFADGYEFAALDGTHQLQETLGCQTTPLALPEGWSLASDAAGAARDHTWGTACLVGADGAGWTPRTGSACGASTQLVTYQVDGVTYFKPDFCNKRVLIRKAFVDEYKLGLRMLVVSVATNVPTYSTALAVLESAGIAHDVHLTLNSTTGEPRTDSLTSVLVDAAGNPKYQGIILTTSGLVNEPVPGQYVSTLSNLQWHQLRQYTLRYRARIVSLFTFPGDSEPGLEIVTASADATNLQFDSSALHLANVVPHDAVVSVPQGVSYQYRVRYDATLMHVHALLRYTNNTTPGHVGDDHIAAITLDRMSAEEVRTQEMHFFFDTNANTLAGAAFGPVWLSWITNGHYLGLRRNYLSIHIDDLFLPTNLYNTTLHRRGLDSEPQYRISAADLAGFDAWLQQRRLDLPSGSDLRVEWAFNGAGVIDVDSDSLLEQARQLLDSHFFVSHTWSHPSLDFVDAGTMYQELNQNYNFTMEHLYKSMDDLGSFSDASLVTPMITGLFNGEALRVISEFGIKYVIGDNSRANLRNPDNMHHPLDTTVQDNGFAGLRILPRFPINVFFDASTRLELVTQFNDIYGPGGSGVFARDLTFDEILDTEAELHGAHLLALLHDAYMFHQANVRGGADSLLAAWIDAVLQRVLAYNTLPIRSLRMDDLGKAYDARLQRDQCGLSACILLKNGKGNAIMINSTGECVAAFTGAFVDESNGANDDILSETYGPDHTLWVPMTPGASRTVYLNVSITPDDDEDPKPQTCRKYWQCYDGDRCTVDRCHNGRCDHRQRGCDDKDGCTIDYCDPVRGCVHERDPACHIDCKWFERDWGRCDDGNVCTLDDHCDPRHGCVYGDKMRDCDDGNACTEDWCDAKLGCVHQAITCDDRDDACTLAWCDGKQGCQYRDIECYDGDECTEDACDADKGCVFTPVHCDDGNPCTADRCDADTGCYFPDDYDCDDKDPCTDDLCNAADGTCYHQASWCYDNDACTEDSCDPKTGCVHQAITCKDDDACTRDLCDSKTGCVFLDKCEDGDACTLTWCDDKAVCRIQAVDCDDGDACTRDTCNSKHGCTHEPLCSSGDDKCVVASCDKGNCYFDSVDCDDGNACTHDVCHSERGCRHRAVDCDDKDPCTADKCDRDAGCVHDDVECYDKDGDPCTEAYCVSGVGCRVRDVDCDDGDACTQEWCDAKSGGCVYTPVDCDDGDACTVEYCDSSKGCVRSKLDCGPDDDDKCTVQYCDKKRGCVTEPKCDDNNNCTKDSCNAKNGRCRHSRVRCDDDDACTNDWCRRDGGCQHTSWCDDEDVCTIDKCTVKDKWGNIDCSYEEIKCDDGNPCTEDWCGWKKGCVFQPIDWCDDDNECTRDYCDSARGGCVFEPISCDDDNACTIDHCDRWYGCWYDTVSCYDGDECTCETCDPKVGCLFTEETCDDYDECTIDSCHPKRGCRHQRVSCDDDDECTDDYCHAEVGCVHDPIDCYDWDKCTDEVCDPKRGCVYTDVTCSDDTICTENWCDSHHGCMLEHWDCSTADRCLEHSCDPVKGCVYTEIDCEDGDPCTQDWCSSRKGCVSEAMSCDDDNECTKDTCDASRGGCVFDPVQCDDGKACTDDLCDKKDGCFFKDNCSSDDPCVESWCGRDGTCVTDVRSSCRPSNGMRLARDACCIATDDGSSTAVRHVVARGGVLDSNGVERSCSGSSARYWNKDRGSYRYLRYGLFHLTRDGILMMDAPRSNSEAARIANTMIKLTVTCSDLSGTRSVYFRTRKQCPGGMESCAASP